MYTSIHDLGPRYLHDLFIIKDTEYDYRNVLKIELSRYKTVTYGENTLQFNGAKLFNSLKTAFKNRLNYSEFKAKLKTWYGEECLCNNCTYCRLMLCKCYCFFLCELCMIIFLLFMLYVSLHCQ